MMEVRRVRDNSQVVRAGLPSTNVVTFLINGVPVHAYEGDTVLTAVLAHAGSLRLSEFMSLPRSGFCLMGACQDCWVTCNDGGRLRACTTMIQSGMSFCIPSTGLSGSVVQAGDDRAADDRPEACPSRDGSCAPDSMSCSPGRAQAPELKTVSKGAGVVVIGAGPAGIRACEVLVKHGLRPVLIDESPRPGGQIYRQPPAGRERPAKALYGFEAGKARRLHETARSLQAHIDYRPDTLVWNASPGMLDLHGPHGIDRQPYDHLIIATGANDRVLPFKGWTMPGVYTLGGSQVSLKYQHCLVGRRIAFIGTGPLLYLVAYQYARQGAEIAGVFDSAPRSAQLSALPGLCRKPGILARGLYYQAWLRCYGVSIHTDCIPVRVEGDTRVEGVRVRQGSSEWALSCDAVAIGYGLRSETQLADLLECEFDYQPLHRAWLPRKDEAGRSSVAGVYLAGDGSGIGGADMAELEGARAALALLADVGHTVPATLVSRLRRRMRRWRAFRAALEQAFPFPDLKAWPYSGDTFLCRCEEITYAQAAAALEQEGPRDLNRLKALCRVGMGRCQGRMCVAAAAEFLASQEGSNPGDVGRLRAQAPVKPLPLAALGADFLP